VTHFIEGAAFPNLEHKAQVRSFRLEGDRLVLEAATPWASSAILGSGESNSLTWSADVSFAQIFSSMKPRA
jgi:hypothetical protein